MRPPAMPRAPQPSIRALDAGDLDALRALVGDVLAEFGLPLGGADLGRELADAQAGGRGGFWGVDDGGLAGCVSIRPRAVGVAELRRLYLRADRRGLGLGQALYAWAEGFARAAGYETLWLASSRRFAAAHALYLRNGLARVARLDNAWEDDLFEKRLA